jgi:selenide,water dikinase
VGGHTVEDSELKYGLSVTGTIQPDAIVRNSTARPGDILILTKPIGSGIISTAVKGEMATREQEAEAVRWMATLNRTAGELMLRHNPSACTDVTGFGLIGHALEMAKGSGVTIRLYPDRIPLMSGVPELIGDGMVPAGCYQNRQYYIQHVDTADFTTDRLLPFFDPQTSGGLLISLAPDDADAFLSDAQVMGLFAVVAGEVATASDCLVKLV